MTEPSPTFFCPITHELMNDPVMDPDGNSYERVAIEGWVRSNSTSPITRAPLAITDLRPNRALKAAIEDFRRKTEKSQQSECVGDPIPFPSEKLTVSTNYVDGFLHISVKPPTVERRAPCDICCVVDTSGSMAVQTEIEASENEKVGLSRLDLVKHAMKTIIHSLEPQDRLSLVSFSNNANVLFTLTKMNQDGKSSALAALERLEDNGQTNLWDGLRTGVELLIKDQRAVGSHTALFLLTDGCPNIEPPRGHVPTLIKLKDTSNFSCSINTFGFGYDLDSKLLEELSIVGNCGSYAFIPDGSFVGTIFVNAIATMLSTVATNVQIAIRGFPNENSIYTRWHSTIGGGGDNTVFNMGSISYGQSKDLILPISGQLLSKLEIGLTYDTVNEKKIHQQVPLTKTTPGMNENLLMHNRFRLELVNSIRDVFELKRPIKTNGNVDQQKLQAALDQLQSLEREMSKYANGNDPYVNDLLKDLTGQVREATSRDDWFKKWGIHYLPSLVRAHLFQYCNNFKDPGIQHYGQGELFSKLRDDMDTIFCSLPAPKPAHNGTTIDMNAFHNPSGGCFYGGCLIQLMDGSKKLVKHVKPGDQLAPFAGTVKYVIKSQCPNGKAKMVALDQGLIISAWHPIRLEGHWMMPCTLVTAPIEIDAEEIYNFVLDQGHTVLVNGIQCVTLGHGFRDDIVRHSYYGTDRVIHDLIILDEQQNNNGIIKVSVDMLQRNHSNGLVAGLNHIDAHNAQPLMAN